MSPLGPNAWFPFVRPSARPGLKLICVPFAGGGASAYRTWQAQAPGLEIWAAQPPGRETRFREPLLRSVRALAESLVDALTPALSGPYAMFGHSLGALVIFEAARELRRRGLPLPLHLFVSARGAPHLPHPEPACSHLPRQAFFEAVLGYGGVPAEVAAHPELLEVVEPVLRADFASYEQYACEDAPPLDIPLTAIGGTDDRYVPVDLLEPWREHSTRFSGTLVLPVGHFYLSDQARPILEQIASRLTSSPNP